MMSTGTPIMWAMFVVFVLVALLVDFFAMERRGAHKASIVLRAVMTRVGAWLIAQFHWIMYLFGAFLVFTGIKMRLATGQEPDLEANPALNWIRRHMKISPTFDGE